MIADNRKFLGGTDTAEGGEIKNVFKPKTFIVTDVVEKKNGYVNPVIVNFQNGDLKDGSGFNVSITPNGKGAMNVEVETPSGHVFKDNNCSEMPQPNQVIVIRNRKTNKMLGPKGNSCCCSGRPNKFLTSRSNCKRIRDEVVILIIKHKNGKVKLVEVDSTVLLNSALFSALKSTEEVKDYKKDFRTLQKTFGGKKIVSRLEQKEKLNLSSLPIADEVKKAVKDIKVEGNISLNESELESFETLLPPAHRDATNISNVYVMNEILTEEELQSLKNEMSTIEENKFNPNDYSVFFMDCYAEAKKSQNDLEERLAGILFAETLIKFLRIPSKKVGVKKTILCSFSTIIHEKLLNEFCVKTETSVTRPLTMRDKCLCYIIALSLICCNYKVNLKNLSTITSVRLQKLVRLARAVGAVPLPKQEHLVVLKLPLPALPKAPSGKVQRK